MSGRCNCPRYLIPSADPNDSNGCPVHDPNYVAPITDTVLTAVHEERTRQDKKWGFPQVRTKSQWVSIIAEELGEVAQLVNDMELAQRLGRTDHAAPTPEALEEELVQTAACVVAFIKHLRGGYVA